MAKGTITVVGLGSGDKEDLTFETWDLLKGANRLFLRTEDHPVVSWLKRQGLTYRTFDDVYERYDRFQPVYEEVVETLFREAAKGAVVYAVPGHPMVAEKTTQLLLDRGPSRGIRVDVKGGRSFLEALFGRLRLDPIDGFLLLDGSSLVVDQLNPRLNTVIAQVYDSFTASDVKLTLMERYPDDWEVVVVHALGITGKEAIIPMPLYALDRSFPVSSHSLVVVPPVPEEVTLKGDFTDFVRIVSALRGPDGCPWDKAQTHESLRKYMVEETAEFIEAVNRKDTYGMCEELGDVLLQVVLHAQIASESGAFSIGDVIRRIADKMIRRHPHVFTEAKAKSASDVEKKWEEIKAQEKEARGHAEGQSITDGIPCELPTLSRAETVQKRAAKAGFDWDAVDPVVEKVREELAECVQAPPEERELEVGDLLFAVVNLARFLDVDPEQALRRSTLKFAARFDALKKEVEQNGGRMEDLHLAQLDAVWEKVKRKEKLL